MGGQAFRSGDNPLCTPRMRPAVYLTIRDHCQELLRRYYTHVGTPIEAPTKEDYGDVDILVACPTSLLDQLDHIDFLARVLGAVQVRKGLTSSFAIPWPQDLSLEDQISSVTFSENRSEYFIQVDVNICQSKESWDWQMFHHAHGDLWNVLGSTIRRFGLTVNNRGLYLRIEEIETVDRNKSMIFLTEIPNKVLEFLGLNETRWWKQFESVGDLFEYAAGCRFFSVAEYGEDVEEDKRKLKHNDRQRMAHRVVFRRWIEEFIPACRVEGRFLNRPVSREQIKLEAFCHFAVEHEYNQRLDDWRRVRQVDDLWHKVIKAVVPVENVDPQFRASSLRGLKTIIIEEDYRDGITPSKSLKHEDGTFDIDATAEFVSKNWKSVGEVRTARQRARAAEAIQEKKRKQAEQTLDFDRSE